MTPEDSSISDSRAKSQVTMGDIARCAGVSRTTTSFVLNNRQSGVRISDRTRQRVLNVAHEMGYLRNELARAVVTGKNFVLGYLMNDPSEQDSKVLSGILKEANDGGYLVKVLSHDPSESYMSVVQHCAEHRLAGLIVRRCRPEHLPELRDALRAYEVQHGFVDDNLNLDGASCVTSDDVQGCQLAVDHLVQLKHKRIAYISGDPAFPQTRLRQDAFRQMMKERDLTQFDGAVMDSLWEAERIEGIVCHLFGPDKQHPTGLICDGDSVAAIAIRKLRSMRISVPGDVSVIGYGGFNYGAFIDPPLTTVVQPFAEMGRIAVKYLLENIERRTSGEVGFTVPNVLLPTSLNIRASTAVCKSEN